MPTLYTVLRAQHRHKLGARKKETKPSGPLVKVGVSSLLQISRKPGRGKVRAIPHGTKAVAGHRIAIIGAGLAGLCAAFELRSMGYQVSVYEARERVGGRVHSLKEFIKGKTVEGGGELIGSNHALWIAYAKHFGLKFTDAEDYGNSPVRLNGRTLTFEQGNILADEMDKLKEKLNLLAETIVDPFEPWMNRNAKQLDDMSVAKWIDKSNWKTTASKKEINLAKTAMKEQLASDNGIEAREQSLLGVLAMIKGGGVDRYWSDTEVYRCEDGNQQLAERFCDEIIDKKGEVVLATKIEKVVRNGRKINFIGLTHVEGNWKPAEIKSADEVILAVPPSVWGNIRSNDKTVDGILRGAPRMGKNVKFLMSFKKRFWEDFSSSPTLSEDGPVDMTWETTEADKENDGEYAMVAFSGAKHAETCAKWGDKEETKDKYMRDLKVVYPAIDKHLVHFEFMNWPEKEKWTKASYYFPRLKEVRKWGPIWKMGVDDWFHFAGEHTSYAFMGYMEGALTSGFRLARRIAVRDKLLPG